MDSFFFFLSSSVVLSAKFKKSITYSKKNAASGSTFLRNMRMILEFGGSSKLFSEIILYLRCATDMELATSIERILFSSFDFFDSSLSM